MYRFRGEESEGVTVVCPIKDQEGRKIGQVKIQEDGTFSGKLDSGSFQDAFGAMARLGLSDGIMMFPKLLPAIPALKE